MLAVAELRSGAAKTGSGTGEFRTTSSGWPEKRPEGIGRVPHVRLSVHGPKKMGAALTKVFSNRPTHELRDCPHSRLFATRLTIVDQTYPN